MHLNLFGLKCRENRRQLKITLTLRRYNDQSFNELAGAEMHELSFASR